MDLIIHYLKDGSLPNDNGEAQQIRAHVSQHWLFPYHKLYRRSYSCLYIRCVHPKKVKGVLFELHEGNCESDTSSWSIAHRVRSQSYWWPYMQKGTLAYTKKCDKCQTLLDYPSANN